MRYSDAKLLWSTGQFAGETKCTERLVAPWEARYSPDGSLIRSMPGHVASAVDDETLTGYGTMGRYARRR